MSYHNVTILQKNYNISCSENEIPRLEECTKAVNQLLEKMFKNTKSTSETTIMALTLLTIMDELLDCKSQLAAQSGESEFASDPNDSLTPTISADMLHKLETLHEKLVSIV